MSWSGCLVPGFVPLAPCRTALDVSGQVLAGELLGGPVLAQYFGVGVADVGPAVASVGEIQPLELVHRVFERIQDPPLLSGQAGQEVTAGCSVGGGETGVDPFREGCGAPALRGCGAVVGYAVDEGDQDVRELQASVDEQRLRGRR